MRFPAIKYHLLTWKLPCAFLILLLLAAKTPPAMAQPFAPQELPSAGTSHPGGPPLQPRAWSISNLSCGGLSEKCGWLTIMFVNVSQQSEDTFARMWLCGYYGITGPGGPSMTIQQRAQFGCMAPGNVLSAPEVFVGPFVNVEALTQAANATPTLPVDRKVHAVDIDMDGKSDHLCVRVTEGIGCVGFNAGTFDTQLRIVQSSFSDSAGWASPWYEHTIGFPVLGGVRAVCGRGIAGMHCFRWNSSTQQFDRTVPVQAAFADAYGWSRKEYFSTISYINNLGEDSDSVCARGSDGILCASFNKTTGSFRTAELMTRQFRDADGWGGRLLYSTIRFLDLNDDGKFDVCGRGHHGFFCGVSNGLTGGSGRFRHAEHPTPASTDIALGSPPFSAWDVIAFKSTRVPNVQPLLCERRFDGLYCIKSTTTPGHLVKPTFSALRREMVLNDQGHGLNFIFGYPGGWLRGYGCWISDEPPGSGSTSTRSKGHVYCAAFRL